MKKYFDFETILTSDSFDAELSMAVNNKKQGKNNDRRHTGHRISKKKFFNLKIDENAENPDENVTFLKL